MTSVEHIFPSAAELDKVITKLNCPHCTSVFTTGSNLNLHLAKTHKLPHLLQSQALQNVTKVYHCPVTTCSYNESRHFKQYKFIKQHYLKMHSEKKFICEKCKAGFSTEASKRSHFEYCDISFKCCDCSAFYNSYETLKTHGRRKKHRILDKIKYKTKNESTSNVSLSSSTVKFLLLKNSKSLGVLSVSNTSEGCSQTDTVLNHSDMQTQTFSVSKSSQQTVETQTIENCQRKAKKGDTIDLRHMDTQTILTEPKSVSCNTICTGISAETDEGLIIPRSFTQTMITGRDLPYSTPTRTFDSIHTDTSDLLTDTLDSNYFNCHMETQTDFMFNGDLLKCCDYYAHMNTQTIFDDVLKSVESQTVMSHSDPTLSCRDMTYETVETQTIENCQRKAKKDEIIDLRHMNTQTTLTEPKSASCNTICAGIRNETDEDLIIPRSFSSTQTMITDCDLSCSTPTFDSIHTDTSDLLIDTLDSNYFNCHMETQTDFMFNGDDSSHMYTQTCDNLLLGEIGLNDIQTQTVFDDFFKSVESQTVMSHSDPTLSCRDMTYRNSN